MGGFLGGFVKVDSCGALTLKSFKLMFAITLVFGVNFPVFYTCYMCAKSLFNIVNSVK